MTEQQRRSLFLNGLAGCVSLLMLAELFCAVLVQRYPLALGDFQKPEDLIYTVKASAGKRPFGICFGESVMHWKALASRGEANPKGKSVAAFFRALMREAHPEFIWVDACMDGSLAGDYEGLLSVLREQQLMPSAALVQVDYRFFSELHKKENFTSRKWLGPFLPQDGFVSQSMASSGMFRPIDRWVYANILYRSDLLLLFSALANISEPLEKPSTNPPDSQDLRVRIAPYYSSSSLFAEGESIRRFEHFLDRLHALRVPTMIVFTPINYDFVGNSLNGPTYRANLAFLKQWFEARYGLDPGMRLLVIDRELPVSQFIDHCHLTAEGNRQLATLIFERFEIFARECQTSREGRASRS